MLGLTGESRNIVGNSVQYMITMLKNSNSHLKNNGVSPSMFERNAALAA